jgi:DNA-binding transcriptional MerR regulator
MSEVLSPELADEQAGRPGKSSAAFRTISEVADDLDVAQHVLRFWESKFAQVRPLKRGGGRRYYRPEDIDLLRQIRSLLYDEGYTIKGAQKLLRARRTRLSSGDEPAAPRRMPVRTTVVRPTAEPDWRGGLAELRAELQAIRQLAAQAREEL